MDFKSIFKAIFPGANKGSPDFGSEFEDFLHQQPPTADVPQHALPASLPRTTIRVTTPAEAGLAFEAHATQLRTYRAEVHRLTGIIGDRIARAFDDDPFRRELNEELFSKVNRHIVPIWSHQAQLTDAFQKINEAQRMISGAGNLDDACRRYKAGFLSIDTAVKHLKAVVEIYKTHAAEVIETLAGEGTHIRFPNPPAFAIAALVAATGWMALRNKNESSQA